MEINRATLDDVPGLCALLQVLFTQEAEFTADGGKQRRGLEQIIRSSDLGEILVAREAGRILGMINLLFTVSTALGGPVAVFEDMVVAPDTRRRGIGSALLEGAIERAVQKGCRRISLLADPDNDAAHRFYRRHGFERSSMVTFRRNLDGL
jgi:ribosomal protein S18 acetylase RimI-like enzyme